MAIDVEKLDGRLLLCFDALMQHRSVSRAAEQMGVTQPAMSLTLRRLRALFSDPLLVRGARTMVPTPRALALVPPVRALLQELREVAADAPAFDPATSTARFVLSAAEYAAFVVVPGLTRYLERHAPGISLEVLVPSVRGQAQQWLESGETDFRIAWAHAPDHALHTKVLYTDDFVCLVDAHHPTVRRQLSFAQFCTLPHVRVAVPQPQLTVAIDQAVARRGGRVRSALTVRDFLLAPHAVIGSSLVATVPRRFALGIAARLPVRLLPPPIPLPRQTVSLYWHERTHDSPAHRWLRKVLGSVVARRAAGWAGGAGLSP